nr:hypothetical protein [Tanacetum cinerariifolium]
MSNLSKNENDSIDSDEYEEIRVGNDVTVDEIEENSCVKDKDEIVDGEKVEDGCEKEMEHEKQSRSDVKENESALNDSAAKTVDANEGSKKDNGDEVVFFDEAIVEEGSKKWLNTVCGYFVGCNMSPTELRYNIRRMWSRGYEQNMDQSPRMVNGKPMMVQKWNPDAWSVKGISTLASKLGKPLVMDEMTASMCHNGTERSAFARLLVEIKASKGFNDKIEIQYKDKNNNVIRTKFVKAEFSWKPIRCSHCNVFGHNESRCHNNGTKKDQLENNKGNVNHDNGGFVEVKNKRNGI